MSKYDNMLVTFDRVTLEAIRFYASKRLPTVVARTLQLDRQDDMLADELVYVLHGYVYGKMRDGKTETDSRELILEYPATWWQAFKLSAINNGNPFFDPAKIRYARKTRKMTVDVTQKAADWWPELDLPMPENAGRPITIALPPSINWKFEGDL